ncbi:CDP-alcohol phosphatidyltransferase family protein [Brucepastera parasyntrophica]|uniref:CDP-alcohol phosphatidyltransferase family protein n=1 Tax=Brucepastera parasyntrophica TaxID=2880008 RepID=UPI00210EB115|nr:CDP-alcohol phosphatidyltransferase family protein [Brucepastera parasyntrophica]ULQ60053.1 CDP-alcohol phosphatidyltransferase family protein [Brucepastera parasyntrophica]
MKYRFKDIYSSLPPEKRKSDGTVTTYLFRPLSYPFAYVFLALNFTPNMVTYIGAFCCIAGLCLTFFPVLLCHRIAMGLFVLFAVLDCADGTMARTLKLKSPYGGWVDAMGGYLAYAAILTSIGFSCLYRNGDFLDLPFFEPVGLPWQAGTWLFLGGFAATANILMRLNHQSFKNAELLAGKIPGQGKEKRFSEEIGVTGYLPLLYIAGFETGFLPVVLLIYTIIYAGGCLLSTLKLILRAGKNEA